MAIPKPRQGSYFPGWLLERRRAEAALVTVVATSCLLLGLRVTSAGDGAGWLAAFRDLTARGLTGAARGHQRRPLRADRGDRRHFARRGPAAWLLAEAMATRPGRPPPNPPPGP